MIHECAGEFQIARLLLQHFTALVEYRFQTHGPNTSSKMTSYGHFITLSIPISVKWQKQYFFFLIISDFLTE